MRAFAADNANGGRNAGAIDQDPGFAIGFGGFRKCSFRCCGVGDVTGNGLATDFGSHFFGLLEIHIQQRNLRAGLCQCPCGCRTEA